MITTINTIEEYEQVIAEQPAALIYFSHEQCNVCKVLKPKIEEVLEIKFPKMSMYYADTKLQPEIAAQHSVFTVPTILVYFDRREFYRKSRNIGISELKSMLFRPYELMFS